MVKHIILWKLKDEYTPDQKCEIKNNIRTNLEALAGRIPGLLDIRVHTDTLPSANVDLMLDSTFTDADALAAYSVHPAHTAVANTYVRPHTAVRSCFDFELSPEAEKTE